jgi:hypothetical protein
MRDLRTIHSQSTDGGINVGRGTDSSTTDRRREPRIETDLALVVWGVDTKGDRFLQEARARDISVSGALLSGLDASGPAM